MTHEHVITDSDKAFEIDVAKRSITNSSGKLVLIQYDHNSERFAFKLPRFVEGHDMAESTSIQIHYINVGSNSTNNSGVYGVNDAKVDPENDEMMTFTWLVSSNCTQFVGSLSFAVRFSCVKNGITEYSWGTQAYSSISISTSILNSETVVQEHADIIAAWEARIAALEQGVGGVGLPEGGTEGQVLSVDGEGNYIWTDVEIPESVTSWNDLEDKPFYVDVYPIGFDSAQGGMSESNYVDMNYRYAGPYDVDEWNTSADTLIGCTVTGGGSRVMFGTNQIESELEGLCEQVVTYDDCAEIGNGSSYVMFVGAMKPCIVFVSEADAGTTALDLPSSPGSTYPATFPSAGMWVMKYASQLSVTSIEYREYHALNQNFLPKADYVDNAAGDTPTAAEFNALLESLRAAGYLARTSD